MKKIILSIAAIIGLALLSGCGHQPTTSILPTPATPKVQTIPNESYENDFDMQNKCATAANNASKQYTPSYSYTNHWNKSLSKCFVEVVVVNNCGKAKTVFDVAEDRNYAMYYPCNKECQVSKNGNPDDMQACYSEADFDNLVQPYMNN